MFKGQGSLEYLLILSGAVTLAAVVLVLTLGIGSSTEGQTDISSAVLLCQNKALLATPPDCDFNGTGPIMVTINGKCYTCGGEAPACSATYTPGLCGELCGNAVCDTGEDNLNCPADCGVVGSLPSSGGS